MLNMSQDEGIKLIDSAKQLGINIVDAHHRYGNCEFILGQYDNIQKMTKISAYSYPNIGTHIQSSQELLKHIDIMWVSDLDNKELYSAGEDIYKNIYKDFPVLGINSESPELVMKFHFDHPECNYYMIPLFIGNTNMVSVCKYLVNRGKNVFTIKPFNDGLLLNDYSIEDCLRFVKSVNPSVMIFGTKQIKHLEEVVEIWKR